MTRPGVTYKAMAGPGELLGATLDGVGASGVANVRAVIATLNRIDADSDVTLSGYFGTQNVQVVPVHDWNHVPIGKGRVYEQGDQAIAGMRLNLSIPQARAWWEAFKFDLSNPPGLQEFSYGFTVKDGGSFEGRFGGRKVRFLQPLPDGSPGVVVHEVGPVMLGSGVGTGLLEVAGPADVDQGPDLDMARECARFVRSTLEAA